MRSTQNDTNIMLAIEDTKILFAKFLIIQLKAQGVLRNLQEAEFKVFSQWGDDGIIQYLIHLLDIRPHCFIEFGVENYHESNTRFLLMHDNWEGLVIDSDHRNILHIQNSEFYWRHALTAVCDFVDRDNVNQIFEQHGFVGEVGILSIDIDGNDLWVWEAITAVNPQLVIIEYNSVFGAQHAISIPYDREFQRTRAHHSNLYFGASLKALCLLGEKKGYALIGTNSAGNNAYFVRQDKLGPLNPLSVDEGYTLSKFRESQHPQGGNSYVSGDERLKLIQDMVVYDIEHHREIAIRELLPQ